jgi:isopentenyl diphosphate isomerase/L-lactate dehydrogenase-like FMN-dependent dehydrogenase
MAGPFLKAATVSAEKVAEVLEETVRVLRIAMFAAGAGNIETLKHTPLVRVQ